MVTDTKISDIPPTIPAALARAVERFGDIEALVDDRERLNYVQLAARVRLTVRALMACGIEKGDRVAIWAPNSTEWVIAALGIYCSGAVLVPLNTRFKGGEAAYVLQTAGARLLFTVTDFLDTDYAAMLRGAGDLPDLDQLVVFSGEVPPGALAWADFQSRAIQVSEDVAAARTALVAPDDLSDLLFTSGTTGAPKGAMLRHHPSTRAYTAWNDVVGLRTGDRYLIINPYFHGFGLKSGILSCVLSGVTNIPQPVFDVPEVMRRVESEKITMMPGTPTLFQTILDHPQLHDFDLSSLRLTVTGAATVPVELIRRMRDELTFKSIVTGYGLTEATGIATMCRHDDDLETIATTAGRAIPDVEVRIVADDGTLLAAGEPGEVVIGGYVVMSGYWNAPEATAAAIDADGWLHTGDIGVMDRHGNVRITDRKKDMYIVGGFNAYPAEIENMMTRHPKVSQVAVVGVPDPRMGEVGMAFVIPRLGATITPDELIAWCRDEMANYKVPRYVEIVDSLPLNASNKVMKFELRARGAAVVAGSAASAAVTP